MKNEIGQMTIFYFIDLTPGSIYRFTKR